MDTAVVSGGRSALVLLGHVVARVLAGHTRERGGARESQVVSLEKEARETAQPCY